MPIFVVPVREYNDCNLPAGASDGGQFGANSDSRCGSGVGTWGPSASPRVSRGPASARVSKPSGTVRTVAGLTSARPDNMSPRDAFEKMQKFADDLTARGIPARVQPSMGAWAGSWEPSWTVSVDETADATMVAATLAEYGKKYDQDAVLLAHDCEGSDCNSEAVEMYFDRAVTRSQRSALAEVLTAHGMQGWTWYKAPDGRTTLRMVHVPQWGGTFSQEAFDTTIAGVYAALAERGYGTEVEREPVRVEVFGRERGDGIPSYDDVLEGSYGG